MRRLFTPPIYVPGYPTGSPRSVACRERDFYQRGVLGDGEGGGSGDEEMWIKNSQTIGLNSVGDMRKRTIFILSVVGVSIIFSFLTTPALAEHGVFDGKVVGTEFSVIQVKGDNGRVSVFWLGHKTHLDSRVPFFGDRVRIEFIKDKLGRNAVTRITILGR